jgi:hypothetical protein
MMENMIERFGTLDMAPLAHIRRAIVSARQSSPDMLWTARYVRAAVNDFARETLAHRRRGGHLGLYARDLKVVRRTARYVRALERAVGITPTARIGLPD